MHVYIITRIYAHMCLQDRCQSLIPLYFNFDTLSLTEPGTHRLSTLVHQQAPEIFLLLCPQLRGYRCMPAF